MSKSNNKIYKYLIAFFLIMALSIVYKLLFKGDASGIVYVSNSSETPAATSGSADIVTNTVQSISIYICGAVNSPGVYEVNEGTILNDVINIAGGLSDRAAAEYINLVYEIRNNTSIYIPTYEEIMSGDYSDGIIYRSCNSSYQWGDGSNNSGESSLDSGLININSASREELMTLPGIGEATADAIITYRENNVFMAIEDIMNVSGIGESKFNRISALITVD